MFNDFFKVKETKMRIKLIYGLSFIFGGFSLYLTINDIFPTLSTILFLVSVGLILYIQKDKL